MSEWCIVVVFLGEKIVFLLAAPSEQSIVVCVYIALHFLKASVQKKTSSVQMVVVVISFEKRFFGFFNEKIEKKKWHFC